MLAFPYLVSHGFVLYRDFINPYPPLLTVILSGLFGLFGYSVIALKVFTWILIVFSDVVFILILDLFMERENPKLLFLFSFIVLRTFLDGNMLWFDNALVLPLLISFYWMLKWIKNPQSIDLILSLIALTVTVLIKQTALLYFLIPLVLILLKRVKDLVYFLLPVLLIAPFVLYLIFVSALRDFWLWNFYYPINQWSKFPGYVDFNLTRKEQFTVLLLLLPVIFFRKRKLTWTILSFLLLSAISVYPRFSFFHLQSFIAFMVVFSAYIFGELSKGFKKVQLATMLVASLIVAFINFRFDGQTRFYDQEHLQEAQIIDQYTTIRDKVFLIGIDPSVYVYSNRLPPKKWVDNYVWYFEIPGVQEKLLQDFRQSPPKLILRKTPQVGPWYGLGVYQPAKIVGFLGASYNKRETFNSTEVWIKK